MRIFSSSNKIKYCDFEITSCPICHKSDEWVFPFSPFSHAGFAKSCEHCCSFYTQHCALGIELRGKFLYSYFLNNDAKQINFQLRPFTGSFNLWGEPWRESNHSIPKSTEEFQKLLDNTYRPEELLFL